MSFHFLFFTYLKSLSLSLGWYQSTMPGHEPPYCEFQEVEAEGGAPTAAWGLGAAKAARGAAVRNLTQKTQQTFLT